MRPDAALRSHGFLKRSRRQDFQFLFEISLIAKHDTPIGAADALYAPHDLVLPAVSQAATFPGTSQQHDSSMGDGNSQAKLNLMLRSQQKLLVLRLDLLLQWLPPLRCRYLRIAEHFNGAWSLVLDTLGTLDSCDGRLLCSLSASMHVHTTHTPNPAAFLSVWAGFYTGIWYFVLIFKRRGGFEEGSSNGMVTLLRREDGPVFRQARQVWRRCR